MLKIALTNLGKYNEGELIFKWLELPCDFATFTDALEEIGIDDVEYEEYFISDYDTDIDFLYDHLSEYENVELLNWLAGRLETMKEWAIDDLEALLEYGEHADGVLEILDLCEEATCNNCSQIIPNVSDDEQLGRYWIDESGCYDLSKMGNLAMYFDYESFGRDIRIEEGGCYTKRGYIYMWGDDFSGYTAEDIPDEYLLREER